MNRTIVIFLFIGLFRCTDKKLVNNFIDPDPRQEAIANAGIDSIFYVFDSIVADLPFKKRGDTIYLQVYDDLGRISIMTSYPAFRTRTAYYYDKSGDIKGIIIQSDFSTDYHIACITDSVKRVKIRRCINLINDDIDGLTFYNDSGLPDSLYGFTTNQKQQVRYKETFMYNDGKLVQSVKKTMQQDLKIAREGGEIIGDTIMYNYNNGHLGSFRKAEYYPGGNFLITTELFNDKGHPYKLIEQGAYVTIYYRTIVKAQ